MKKLLFPIFAAACVMAACTDSNGFNRYIDTVRSLTQRVDTINSSASYVAFIDTIRVCNDRFTKLGIELNDDQKKKLSGASDSLQQALDTKYAQLAAAVIPVANSDTDTDTDTDTEDTVQ